VNRLTRHHSVGGEVAAPEALQHKMFPMPNPCAYPPAATSEQPILDPQDNDMKLSPRQYAPWIDDPDPPEKPLSADQIRKGVEFLAQQRAHRKWLRAVAVFSPARREVIH
jgi:hypothetical protein